MMIMVVRRTDEGRLPFKLDLIEEMLIDVGVGDMFGFWWHWSD